MRYDHNLHHSLMYEQSDPPPLCSFNPLTTPLPLSTAQIGTHVLQVGEDEQRLRTPPQAHFLALHVSTSRDEGVCVHEGVCVACFHMGFLCEV